MLLAPGLGRHVRLSRWSAPCGLQVAAAQLWKDHIWPDMVARHLPSGGAPRGGAQSVHAGPSRDFERRFKELCGADGRKLATADLKCAGHVRARDLTRVRATGIICVVIGSKLFSCFRIGLRLCSLIYRRTEREVCVLRYTTISGLFGPKPRFLNPWVADLDRQTRVGIWEMVLWLTASLACMRSTILRKMYEWK